MKKILLFLFLLIFYSLCYSIEYWDTIESENYSIEGVFYEYCKLFHVEIETINTSYYTFYTISTIDYVDGFDIELKAKNDSFCFYKCRFRAAIKQDNGTLNLEFHIYNYNFYELMRFYHFLKKNTITAITFSGDKYNETFDIKYYKNFQKNLISMLENINKVDGFLESEYIIIPY